MVPMMRIERMTSPLPRECSTTEPHGRDMERVKGIEPSSGAWKASALPLSYTRLVRCVFSSARYLLPVQKRRNSLVEGDGFEPS